MLYVRFLKTFALNVTNEKSLNIKISLKDEIFLFSLVERKFQILQAKIGQPVYKESIETKQESITTRDDFLRKTLKKGTF